MSLPHIPDRFAGRTAFVTGAGAGIGRAVALRLAGEGATAIGTDVMPSRLDDLLKAAPDLKLSVVQGDLTDNATISALIAASGGRVDVLANVAGIMDGFLPVDETDDATWERVFG